jgi:intein-encoded DNA endonuclease-like protein
MQLEHIKVGDRLYDGLKLGTVEKIRTDGVMLNCGAYNRYLFIEELQDRQMRYVVDYQKKSDKKIIGKSYAETSEKAERERKFLSELGFTCKVYQEEVR